VEGAKQEGVSSLPVKIQRKYFKNSIRHWFTT